MGLEMHWEMKENHDQRRACRLDVGFMQVDDRRYVVVMNQDAGESM